MIFFQFSCEIIKPAILHNCSDLNVVESLKFYVEASTCDFPQYYCYCICLVMLGCAVFLNFGVLRKALILGLMAVTYIVIVVAKYKPIFVRHDAIAFCGYV